MSQIFRSSTNSLARVSIILAIVALAGAGGALFELIADSTFATRQGDAREQPIPFSHAHHVGSMGIDCRYCHTSVENSDFAVIPPQDLHELPFADLDQQPDPRTCQRKFSNESINQVDEGLRSPGFCLFQSQYSCQKRCWLRDLPRP